MYGTAPHMVAAVFLPVCCFAVTAFPASAEDDRRVHEAAKRSVQLVERTSAKFLETRNCFTCHAQTLSAMVLVDARKRGFEVDQKNIKRQFERAFTLHRFTKSRAPSRGVGGTRVDTVGYGLWALDIGQHAPDRMTEDMTWYLLNYQKDLGHWETTVDRPPSEASDFTTNYVAIRGLARYGTAEQKEQIAARTISVKKWLMNAATKDTEDQVFRLRLAYELKMSAKEIDAYAHKLLGEQHENGGWAQKPNMKPDAYATASALVALNEAGGVPIDHPAWKRGIAYLLRAQKADGSWRVKTRSKPMQVYFESGFPHGEDQFISAYATGWAAKALLLALGE